MTDPQNSQYQVQHVSSDFSWAAPMPSVTPGEMAPPRPATLTVASWVWLAATALGVVSLGLLILTNVDGFAANMVESSRNDPSPIDLAEGRIAARVFAGMAFVGGAVVSVPFIIGAIKLRAGRNWPRVMLAVLGGVALIYNFVVFITALTSTNWQLGVALTVLTAGLTIAAIVLMFLPPSNAYVSIADMR
ncbi:hypothetical protein [Lentzea sp. NBRC 105346]|uniref:hypothetical protein n=1 Tax=Lentzea sp. NBRC 105346 TaxID=3032205 RepID=UPI002556CCD2|nr:hypothetical protein [Lentzea sp. NBRC 105346]